MIYAGNKYSRWYLQIIERARDREHGAGMERHHVLPRSMGGGNEKANIVSLTYREHFLAHWLLTKCTDGADKTKMNFAMAMMTRKVGFRIVAAWQYARAKKSRIEAFSGRKLSESSKIKMSEAAKNRSPEYRAKQIAAHTGKKFSEETKEKLSIANKNLSSEKRSAIIAGQRKRGFKHRAETIEKIRKANTGKKRSVDTRAKLSAASMGNKSSLGLVFSDERVARMSAGITAAWARPDVRERQSAAIRDSAQSPEVRARKSAAAKASWADRKDAAL